MYELAEGWRTRLERDLIGFADPGIPPAVERTENSLHAEWTTRGTARSALFVLNPAGELRWVSGPTEDDSYQAFLASEQMADFDQFAGAITRAISRRRDFVASHAIVDTGFEDSAVTATPEEMAGLADRARLRAEGWTSLFFLKGDPGAGKTTLLREATALQAQRYLDGTSEFLFFYVSAQGRELSNLRDAFSGELQDLRAGFTRDAIAALVRAGLLIPVVDGFDELLGTAGYSGAFSSLQSLRG
jgi:NACHT domain